MSYCRWSAESNVYVYLDVGGYINCCGCDRSGYNGDTETMVKHLEDHIADGHLVPDYVIPALLEDQEHNDNWINYRCDACHGDGHPIIDYKTLERKECEACKGEGWVKDHDKLIMKPTRAFYNGEEVK